MHVAFQRILGWSVFMGVLLGPLSALAQGAEELIEVAAVETVTGRNI